MPINFPNSPSLNESYTQGSTTWKWNGIAWEVAPTNNITFNRVVATELDVYDLSVANSIDGVSFSDLDDVSVSLPTSDQGLLYNSSIGKWENKSVLFNGGTITTALFVNNSTSSTNSITGALKVAGGAGIAGNVYIGGTLNIEDEYISLRSRSTARFYNTANNRYVALQASDNTTVNRTYVLPPTDGAAGQVLRTNGSGVLSWTSISAPSGGTAAQGPEGAVQFNDGLEFSGVAGFIYNTDTSTLTVPKLTTTGVASITNSTESNNSSSGALVVSGGLGVAKNINVTGTIRTFNSTGSTSTSSGAVVIDGGAGIAENLFVGGDVNLANDPTDNDHATKKSYVDSNITAFAVAFGA